ncbi:hypothetical protein CH373_09140 [Leptospira perolatii]|uniref:Lipoprotein n=1 Tax=Leptospira perolatii TaxID=2023191 RepID=A0A2M9ZNS2_9LEPT|nr:hypothetical protein [Leptospira perolatii]PJZ69654.1 hypothetical protein CH360_10285 [Leptospira perolatii]PJZ73641.1 hypothetical protein CH373_09140 [Leptospira perolatii]
MKLLMASMAALVAFCFLADCKTKSPEERLKELAPKVQEVMCTKMIDCTKDEMAKLPPEYKNLMPAFMQSKESCTAFMKESFDKSQKQREERNEKVTPEMVDAFESCMASMEKTTCEAFKNSKGGAIPGCEKLSEFSK